MIHTVLNKVLFSDEDDKDKDKDEKDDGLGHTAKHGLVKGAAVATGGMAIKKAMTHNERKKKEEEMAARRKEREERAARRAAR